MTIETVYCKCKSRCPNSSGPHFQSSFLLGIMPVYELELNVVPGTVEEVWIVVAGLLLSVLYTLNFPRATIQIQIYYCGHWYKCVNTFTVHTQENKQIYKQTTGTVYKRTINICTSRVMAVCSGAIYIKPCYKLLKAILCQYWPSIINNGPQSLEWRQTMHMHGWLLSQRNREQSDRLNPFLHTWSILSLSHPVTLSTETNNPISHLPSFPVHHLTAKLLSGLSN